MTSSLYHRYTLMFVEFFKEGKAGVLSPFHTSEIGGSEKWCEALLLSSTILASTLILICIFSPDRFPEFQQEFESQVSEELGPLLRRETCPIYFWFDIL